MKFLQFFHPVKTSQFGDTASSHTKCFFCFYILYVACVVLAFKFSGEIKYIGPTFLSACSDLPEKNPTEQLLILVF